MIKRILIPLLALAVPAFAQHATPAQTPAATSQAAPATPSAPTTVANDSNKPVAVVNGETITVEKLDRMYKNLNTQMRQSYDANGGKGAFLENYIRKRLLIQEALKSGFDKQPEVAAGVESAKESALFDRYVRDIVAAPIVTDKDVKAYYTAHQDEFATPEKLHVRHIVVAVNNTGPAPKTQAAALEEISQIAVELHAADAASAQARPDPATLMHLRLAHFMDAAKKYSQDASAPSGGDLGWVTKGQLDPDFENVAWDLKPGVTSGIVKTKFGYHLIIVDGRQPAGTESYDSVKASVREFLMNQKAADVVSAVAKLTNELRGSSRISVFPENIK